jgi:hypothetical protein
MAVTEGTPTFFNCRGHAVKTLAKKPRTKIEEGGVMFPLAKSLADELGEPELAGEPITLAEFRRCLFRLADIRSGRVKRPEGHMSG